MTDFTDARIAKCEICGMAFCTIEGYLCDCHDSKNYCFQCKQRWEDCECDEIIEREE